MFLADLASLVPMPVTEAASEERLQRELLRLQQTPGWREEGWTRREIMEEVDPEFINHADHYERMLSGGTCEDGTAYPGTKGIRSVTLRADEKKADVIIDGSREWDPEEHSYLNYVRFMNYPRIRRLEGLTWPDKARLLLRDQMRLHCTCPAYRFFYRYGATEKGFALLAEDRPSGITNPDLRGAVCKHLARTLTYLGAWYPRIATGMRQHHGGS
jgi:hypothetical protein